jgi:hypothetical protein
MSTAAARKIDLEFLLQWYEERGDAMSVINHSKRVDAGKHCDQ